MSITGGVRGREPNWIAENDWSPASRLDWIHRIMAFSSRDWGRKDYGAPGTPDPEEWAIWILACIDSKDEALEVWYESCDNWASERDKTGGEE